MQSTRETAEAARRQLIRDVKDTFGSGAGQRVFEHLTSVIYDNSFVKGDPHGTSYNEGARAFALEIYHLVNTPDPEQEEAENEDVPTKD